MRDDTVPDTARPDDGPDGGRATERLLMGGAPRYTRRQTAELAGVDLDRATALWRSLGFATPADDEVVFTDADVDALRAVTSLHDSGLANATAELALTRAVGQAMSRLAEWQVEMLRELVVADRVDESDPNSVATEGLEAARSMLPAIERLQHYVWRRHLLAAADRMLTAPSRPDHTAVMAVGFADVVGFTSLSRGLSEARLGEFLDEFEDSAFAVVAERGGRVVKTVGDEIMFAADSAEAGARIGLDLADRVSTLDGRPDLRTGVAYGPVLRRLGDVYGTVVNLASRLTALARPGTVLVDRELAAVLGDASNYQLKRLRRVSVRGYSHLQPWLLKRAG